MFIYRKRSHISGLVLLSLLIPLTLPIASSARSRDSVEQGVLDRRERGL
jgi:hypothetical protein